MAGRIFVITGPSGVGKTTVAERVLALRPNLRKVVTCTTRAPRDNETDGIHYHFLSVEAFLALKAENATFEDEEVYPGRFYGSRRADVDALLAQGHDVLFVVDPKGARTIKANHPEVVTIFLDAPTDDLLARLQARDKGTTADLDARVAAIGEERAIGEACDHLVRNPQGALDAAVDAISAIMDQ